MKKKVKILGIVIGILILIISASIVSYTRYINYMKENTVTFKNKQIEHLVRHELSFGENEKIMSWDVEKVTHIRFSDEYGEITPSPEDLSELKKLKNLKELIIQSLNSKTNLNTIKELPNLTFLSIFKKVEQNERGEWVEAPINNIDFLRGAPKLNQIIMEGCGLNDISGLENMTTLSYLYIDYNKVEDISVLATLPNLIDFRASDNKIKDISVLKNMKALNYANLTDNPVAKDKEYLELWKVLNKRRVQSGLDKIVVEELF